MTKRKTKKPKRFSSITKQSNPPPKKPKVKKNVG